MSSHTWERLVALVPPPSQSVAGRHIEAATGTMLHVKSFLTQEALSRCMTREQQQKLDAKFSKPKAKIAAVDPLDRLHSKKTVPTASQKWGMATDSRYAALPPLPGAKRKYSVESQYKIVNGRMLGEPEEDEYVRQERSQITAWRLGTFYTWGGRLRHRQPVQRPLSEFYNAHIPGKVVPLRL